MTEAAGFQEFEFDLPDALLTRLITFFDGMKSAPLGGKNVAAIPDAQGVYQLLLSGKVVYVGKTDADAGLKRRLHRHYRTIQHRKNLDPATVTFKAVRLFVFTAMDLETQLIRHYAIEKIASWNKSGFGSNDPGRNRDRTKLNPKGFDARYPIDVDRIVEVKISKTDSAADALNRLNEVLPYALRFESVDRKPHPELGATKVELPMQRHTTRSLLVAIVTQLPKGWQATALAGRVILYRERLEYSSGTVIVRS